MSTFDVLEQFGTARLLRFIAALLLFALLHLARIPLVIIVRVLEFAMRRMDAYATSQASTADPPGHPVNHWFTPTSHQENDRVHAA